MSSMPPNPSTEEEVPKTVRIEQAYDRWKEKGGKESRRKIALQYGIVRTTLDGRINGAKAKKEFDISRQKLTPEEEQVIVKWIIQFQSWGWPARVEHTHRMAEELLQKKMDPAPLDVNWVQELIARHPDLKTAFIPTLDKERAAAENADALQQWFNLYKRIREDYDIEDDDVYNMDEKGFMQGVLSKMKVISRHEKKQYMTQCGNREWVSVIECVSLNGRLFPSWVIFKAKQRHTSWHDAMPDGFIALSEKGWTENELGLIWFENCFENVTANTQKGEYRLLILDGHASYITTEAI